MKKSSLHTGTRFISAKAFSHGGNVEEMRALFGGTEGQITDFSSNVNPFPLPGSVRKALSFSSIISSYPDRNCFRLRKALGDYLSIGSDHIAVGNGASDLLYRLVFTLKPSAGLILSPSFFEYEKALLDVGARINRVVLKEKNDFCLSAEEISKRATGSDLVFLCNPNNPTGKLMSRRDVLALSEMLNEKKIILVVDEAFIDLTEEESVADSASIHPSLIVLRSMTKFWGLAGLRLGYAVGSAELMQRLRLCGQPWPVNIFAQKAGEAVIKDEKFRNASRKKLLRELDFIYQNLCRFPELKPYSSSTHFILIKIENELSAEEIQKKLFKQGILIRDCSSFYGLNEKFFRVAVRSRKENRKLIESLQQLFTLKKGGRE